MNLRPMTLGEILDDSFSMFKEQIKVYLQITGFLVLPIFIMVLLGVLLSVVFDESIAVIGVGIVMVIYVIAANLVGMTSIVYVASEQMARRKSDAKTALKIGLSKVGTQFLSSVLYMIAVFIGSMLLVIPGLYLAVALGFFMEVNTLEKQDAWSALKRSKELTKGSWWRIVGIFFLMGVLVEIISLILQLPFSLLCQLLISDDALLTSADQVISVIATCISTPLTMITATLLYYDLRVRKENFDLHTAVDTITDIQSDGL